MSFVVDASIVACWAFDDESHTVADQAVRRLKADGFAEAPILFWYELRNILIVGERRNRISATRTLGFLRDLALIDIRLDPSPESDEILRLSRTYALTVYDAAYLELALRKRLDLATLDGALVRSARAEAVGVIGLEA